MATHDGPISESSTFARLGWMPEGGWVKSTENPSEALGDEATL